MEGGDFRSSLSWGRKWVFGLSNQRNETGVYHLEKKEINLPRKDNLLYLVLVSRCD